ncbi:PBSX family phage terminase large subunit [Hymenobacter terrenus]|uniref:PBSX family phage terminase large subunit n=1 Tax=Hymenobacter terrenus TaxID=1629124 RepID=UPI0006194225|nr:PBSX family phage terminase large subunit [Hymenobacter terrenus]
MSAAPFIVNDVYLDAIIAPAQRGEALPRYLVLKGGAGAGKSRAIAQYIFFLLTSRRNFKVLAMHKMENRIRETVFAELNTVIKESGFASMFTSTVSPFEIKCTSTDSRVIFRGLDNPDTLKSISGVGLIWMEEADMFTEEDWLQADTRMRGETEFPYQLILTFNPTSELSWLKAKFFDQEYPNSLVLETTYRDNKFLDDAYAETLRNHSPAHRRVYMEGEWGRVSSDGLFYKSFDSLQHVSEHARYNLDLPVWLTFDFNVDPHVTCLVCQPQDEKTLWVVDEIALPSPKNSTKYTSQAFAARYPDHEAGVFITGDANGNHQDTRNERGFNDYTIIETELKNYRPRKRVASKNPPVIPRGNFINDIFDLRWQGYHILINPRCKVLIKDLTYQPETPTGKDKRKAKNAQGVMVEKYGHASDAFDYVVCEVFVLGFGEHLRGPKKVSYQFGKNQLSSKYR